MNSSDYEEYRQLLPDVHAKAGTWAMGHASLRAKVARKLGIAAPDGTFIFDDEEDVSALAESMLYESVTEGQRTITAFFKAYPATNDLEKNLALAMGKASLGLYRVKATDPLRSEISLHGLVATSPDTLLTNVALSQTITIGDVVALRVLQLPGLNMGTGVLFPFPAEKEKRLVREWWTKQGIERFALYRKLCRRDGLLYKTN